MLVAIFFRFYQLTMIPAEFEFDEWAESADALDMLANGPRIFSTLNHGREPLFTYLVAIGFWLVGPQDIVLRIIGATAGMLSIATTYLLVREMFCRSLPHQARWLATLTSLGMAVSFWLVIHTRMGRRHTLMPLFITLAFYFFWRGINTGRRFHFVLSGVLVGGSMYTYPSARFVPIALVIFLLADAVARWADGQPAHTLWRVHRQELLLMGLAAIIVFAPLGYYFLYLAPEQFFHRLSQISIFGGDPTLGANLDVTLWQTVTGSFAGLVWHGDENPLYNIPGRPMLDPVTFSLWLIGLIVALSHGRQRPYAFIIIWWLVLMSPAFLVSDSIPAFKRMYGSGPAVYIFPAIAFVAMAEFSLRRMSRQRPYLVRSLIIVVPLLIYFGVGFITIRDYFGRWGPDHPHYQDVLMYQEIGRKMRAEGRPDEVWLFPVDNRNIIRRYYRLDDFFSYPDLPPRAFIPIDESAMFDRLTAAMHGIKCAVLVQVGSGQEAQSDPKAIFPFLLEKYGTWKRTYIGPDRPYRLDYYCLDAPQVTFQPAEKWQPVDVSFGNFLKLTTAAFGDASGVQPPETPQAISGEMAWVTLRWQATAAVPADYKVSVRLVGLNGHIVSQVDKTLVTVRHRPTSFLSPGEELLDYYLLPLEPGTVPDDYVLDVLLYNVDTGELVPPTSSSAITPGSAIVATVPVGQSVTPARLTPDRPLKIPWGEELSLVGTSQLPASVQPGYRFNLALIWSTPATPPTNIYFSLELLAPDVTRNLLQNIPVGSEKYPTSLWRATETLQQWLSVQLPADVAPDDYTLRLTSPTFSTSASIGTLHIEAGRPHQFEPPSNVQHPADIMFGDRIKLVGSNIVPEADQLTLTLFWQSLDALSENYKVFVHILSPTGQIVIQQDQTPMAGQAPTTSWLPAEFITDEYIFTVPPDQLVPGQYRLEVGLYNELSGQRLPVAGTGNDFVILPESIQVGN